MQSQLLWSSTGTHEYRGFMSKAWFTDRNAGALRGFLRSIILKAFAEQASLGPAASVDTLTEVVNSISELGSSRSWWGVKSPCTR